MTGDDLVTALTEAHDERTACAIADDAPASAVRAAADILYVEGDHSLRWLRNAIVSEARA
jgi:hypothetical protein